MARAGARMELSGVESKINFAETALRSIQKQIEETQKQIKKTPRSRQRKAVFAWQEQAIRLIMLHKFRHTPGDCVLSTQGATITTDELQNNSAPKVSKSACASCGASCASVVRKVIRENDVEFSRLVTSDNSFG